jgi:Sortase domain
MRRRSRFSLRGIWKLRYRFYALIVMVIMLPILYSSYDQVPPVVEAEGYTVTESNFLAKALTKNRLVTATGGGKVTKPPETGQIIKNGDKTIYVDVAGQEITEELQKAGYNLGFISSAAFVDLGLPVGTKQEPGYQAVKVPENQPKTDPVVLNDLSSCPANPQRYSFLRYHDYNISTPIVYSGLDDLFNKNPDGTFNFSSPVDNGPVDSPVQQKLRYGIVHIAFTPQPGEIGNSYVVGHSSNYSFVKSAYNSIFKPLEKKSKPGQEFTIWDRCGRELKFRVFEAKEIREDDTAEAYRNYDNRRVVTLQTSILEFVPGKGVQPTKRWLTRGELIL